MNSHFKNNNNNEHSQQQPTITTTAKRTKSRREPLKALSTYVMNRAGRIVVEQNYAIFLADRAGLQLLPRRLVVRFRCVRGVVDVVDAFLLDLGRKQRVMDVKIGLEVKLVLF